MMKKNQNRVLKNVNIFFKTEIINNNINTILNSIIRW